MFQNMPGPFTVRIKISFQEVGEKEDAQDHKHNEELDQDDPPELPAPGHAPESVTIEPEYPAGHKPNLNNTFLKYEWVISS